ncbi:MULTISPECIES: hypothetical protein [unclassified Exiguobacterium]|jgi:hypothetical protein|uniref:hypothetical protein n=1 Tax=unclassified Exiguobacterium TaxID=2644629 RepID=UPI00064A3ACB|nr:MULTISPECIES: hypothetical protein [unclassified Exiguobacterium]
MNSKNIELKAANLEMMKIRIIEAEKENLRIRSKTESDLIDSIRQIIMEEAKKTYQENINHDN